MDLGATTLLHSVLWPVCVGALLYFKRDLRPEHRAGLLKLALFGALITGPWASLRGGPSLLQGSLLDRGVALEQGSEPMASVQPNRALDANTFTAQVEVPEWSEAEFTGHLEPLGSSAPHAIEIPRERLIELVVMGALEAQPAADSRATLPDSTGPLSGSAVDLPVSEPATLNAMDKSGWLASPLAAVGMGALLVLVLITIVRQALARRWLARLPHSDNPGVAALAVRLKELEHLADRDARVALCVSPELPVPCTWGLWRPVIGVPERALDELDAAELDAVLAHELAHVARRDAWWHMGVQAWLALNPLHLPARRAARSLARATELSADAWAARLTGAPLELAGGLTKVAGWGHGARVPVPALAMAAQPHLVSERVEALLDRRPMVAPRDLAPFAIAALLIAGLWAPRVWAADRDRDRDNLEIQEVEFPKEEPVLLAAELTSPTEELDLEVWIEDQRQAARAALVELESTAQLARERRPEVLPRLEQLKTRLVRHLQRLDSAAELAR